MKRTVLHLVVILCWIAGTRTAKAHEPAPSPQAMCSAMLAILNWNDLRESANATNPDRVRGAGQIRLLGKHLTEVSGHQDPRYQLFYPPKPGIPHSKFAVSSENVAIASATSDQIPKAAVNRLAGLLNDGRNDWQNVRYFYLPFDPLMTTEIASMWQRHARNSPLQHTDEYQGDRVLTQVQEAIEQGSAGPPFWAYLGINGVVHTTEPDGALNLTNAGPGYAKKIPRGTPVKVDYLVTFDPTDSQKPSGMSVILRTAPIPQSPAVPSGTLLQD